MKEPAPVLTMVHERDSIEFDARSRYQEAGQRAANESFSGRGVTYIAARQFDVSARISWKSELGTPGAQSIPAESA